MGFCIGRELSLLVGCIKDSLKWNVLEPGASRYQVLREQMATANFTTKLPMLSNLECRFLHLLAIYKTRLALLGQASRLH